MNKLQNFKKINYQQIILMKILIFIKIKTKIQQYRLLKTNYNKKAINLKIS